MKNRCAATWLSCMGRWLSGGYGSAGTQPERRLSCRSGTGRHPLPRNISYCDLFCPYLATNQVVDLPVHYKIVRIHCNAIQTLLQLSSNTLMDRD
jgi:hypothetical protein